MYTRERAQFFPSTLCVYAYYAFIITCFLEIYNCWRISCTWWQNSGRLGISTFSWVTDVTAQYCIFEVRTSTVLESERVQQLGNLFIHAVCPEIYLLQFPVMSTSTTVIPILVLFSLWQLRISVTVYLLHDKLPNDIIDSCISKQSTYFYEARSVLFQSEFYFSVSVNHEQ